ncbi:MAG: hypothetical protein KBS68_02825 [Clostridiales bacterium]|nr:hypothetical protein [Candidatus Crickella merdequi]
MEKEKILYAADMAANLAKNYRKCMFAGPILMAAVALVIGVLSGVWWQAIAYALVIIFFGNRWNVEALKYATGAAELYMMAEGKIETISQETEIVYQECQASPKALWLGIILLGIGAVALTWLGASTIIDSCYGGVYLPGVFVGVFLLAMGSMMAMPALQWIIMLPRAKKM